jgi:hypothetical protein
VHREERPQLRQVEPAVERGHVRSLQAVLGEPGQVVHVRVDDVELARAAHQRLDLVRDHFLAPRHLIQYAELMRHRVAEERPRSS